VEQALKEIQESQHLPKSTDSFPELASEFRHSTRKRICSIYEEAELPRPCRDVQLADLAAAIQEEFETHSSLGSILCQPKQQDRLYQRIEALAVLRNNHFHSIASQFLREMTDEHGETDAMITAVEEFSTEKLRLELEVLTNRTITDEDIEFCRSLALEKAHYAVKQKREMDERIAGEMAAWDEMEVVA